MDTDANSAALHLHRLFAARQQKQEVSTKPIISMITLGFKVLEESVKFYKDGLGFPKIKRRSLSLTLLHFIGEARR